MVNGVSRGRMNRRNKSSRAAILPRTRMEVSCRPRSQLKVDNCEPVPSRMARHWRHSRGHLSRRRQGDAAWSKVLLLKLLNKSRKAFRKSGAPFLLESHAKVDGNHSPATVANIPDSGQMAARTSASRSEE